MGKKLNPSMSGTLKGSRIRKGIISSERDMGETSEVSKERLASQMTHAVTTADKYYNVQDTTTKDAQVAKFIQKVTGKVGQSAKQSTEISKGDITKELEPHEKKELLRIFSKTLSAGNVPSNEEISKVAKGNETIKGIEIVQALEYLRRKVTEPLTPAVKTATWVQTGARKIASLQATSVTGSGDGGRRFTQYETDIIAEATCQLAPNTVIKDIIASLTKDKNCTDYKLFDYYTRQQLRDKFRNIAKKRN